MPNAGDPYLVTALPLSHNPLQRLGYTSQKPFLDPAVIQAAEDAAITAWLEVLNQQTGIDLTGWWSETVAVRNANQAFTEAIQAAITGSTGPAFIAQCEAAWNTWIVTVTRLSSAQTFSLQQFWNSLFGLNPSTGLTDPSKVGGINVGETLVDTLTTGLNELGAALGGDVADSGGWSWLANLMAGLGVNSTSPLAPIVESAQTSAQILAIVDSEPVQQNLEATVVSSGDHKLAVALTSSPITQTASLGTIVTAGQAKTFGFLQWMGAYTAAVTDFVANFYRMDASGNLVLVFTTSDIGPSVPSTMAWILDVVTALPCAATDLIGIEFQVVTSGTVVPWGFTAPPAGDHPTSLVKKAGFSQNWAGAAATDIAAADIGWVAKAPYIGLGVGTPPPTPFFPQQKPYYVSSTHIPASWATRVDLVGVGAGGGGEGETGAGNGDGGTQGGWEGVTLTVGVTNTVAAGMDIPIGGVITITVGAGGVGGAFFTPGSDGDDTVFSWVNMAGTTETITCSGGLGGQPSTNLTSWGLSPGNFTFDDYPYTGGALNAVGGVGNRPGGGGCGGAAFQFGFAGGRGQAWTVDRQT